MKKLALIIVLFITASVNAQFQKNFIDHNYIEITGTSEMKIIPNEIYLSITINEQDKKGKISVEKQENRLIKSLKEMGLDTDKNFKILDYSSNFKFYFLKKTDIMKSKTYELIVKNGLELGKVYQTLEVIGISNVNITRIDHSEMEEYKQEAKIKAIKAAKLKAANYAEAINQTIGKALYIQETNNFFPRNYSQVNEIMIRRGTSESKDKINNIEFKKIVIQAKVLARFELK